MTGNPGGRFGKDTMKTLTIMLALGFAALCTPVQALDTLRCGSRLVSTQMTAAEVLGACGEPAFRDVWAQADRGALGAVEEWTYNFGSSQLLRVLRFRQGRLLRIEAEGYGFAPGAPRDCSSGDITPGMSKYRLLAACGEPVTRTVELTQVPYDARARRHGTYAPSATLWETVYREEWVYNFGSSRFMRVVRLDNARVAEVQIGGRGFD